MTGPEHYREAERLAAMCVDKKGNPPPLPAPELDAYLGLAQVHATLALAAATAEAGGLVTAETLSDLSPWARALVGGAS